jgi:hypothetical protein
MKGPKSCYVCRANNLARAFQSNRSATALTQFRIAVERLEQALLDPTYFDTVPCQHRTMREDALLAEVIQLGNQAKTPQGIVREAR